MKRINGRVRDGSSLLLTQLDELLQAPNSFPIFFVGINLGKRGLSLILKVKVVAHQAEEGGDWTEVPAILGCATQGDSFDDC